MSHTHTSGLKLLYEYDLQAVTLYTYEWYNLDVGATEVITK